MRLITLGLSVSIVLTLSVSACSSDPSSSAECDPRLSEGSLTQSITVSGAFGTQPELRLPDDSATSVSQRSVILAEASSDQPLNRTAKQGDLVSINFTIVNGATGEELESSEFSPTKASAPVILEPEFSFPALSEGLVCASAGERILIVAAPQDGLGAEGNANWGIDDDATLIVVADVIAVSALQSEGAVRQLPNGFPNVVTTESGRVGLVLPPSNPPEDVRVAARIDGTGVEVTADDTVFAQMMSVNWNTRALISSTWEQGSPISLGSEADGPPVRKELTGYKVGSQIVAITPGQSGTEVSVIDILGVG